MILSLTDPVFAAAIVGRDDAPLWRLLKVESGLNDGLALPFVLIFLATAAWLDIGPSSSGHLPRCRLHAVRLLTGGSVG